MSWAFIAWFCRLWTVGAAWVACGCDAGFSFCVAAFSNALGRMLSAGHCFPINKVVQQGYFDSATATWNFTGNMGKVDWVQWGNNRPDAEEINPSLAGSQPVASRIYNTLTTSVAAVGTVFPHTSGHRSAPTGP